MEAVEPRNDEVTLLARAYRDGDEQAFASLVALLRERLYRLAFRLTGRQEDALDVVQDAFVKVYAEIGSWNERAAFYSWLYRVTTNLALDRLRRRKKDGALQAHARSEAALCEPDHAPRLAEASETELRLARIREAIEVLPEGQRAVMVLRHYEGLSLKEIADVRGCALGTVKSTLHQAFRSVQRCLHERVKELARDE